MEAKGERTILGVKLEINVSTLQEGVNSSEINESTGNFALHPNIRHHVHCIDGLVPHVEGWNGKEFDIKLTIIT